MKPRAYYNEWHEETAWWLSLMMNEGLIPEGDIDTRSIEDVRPEDLKGYNQCHFFAGIGGWPLALRLAGWGDHRPVWTGSPPCQDFSSAGSGKGFEGERDLYPFWEQGLIEKCRPSTIFGEQVERAIAFGWLDRAQHGLEKIDYAVCAGVLPACTVGAPHRRDRIFFAADRPLVNAEGDDAGRGSGEVGSSARGSQHREGDLPQGAGENITLADTNSGPARAAGSQGLEGAAGKAKGRRKAPVHGSASCAGDALGYAEHDGQYASAVAGSPRTGEGEGGVLEPKGSGAWSLGDTIEQRLERYLRDVAGSRGRANAPRSAAEAGLSSSEFWRDHDWILCGDGLYRRTPSAKSGVRLLAHGLPAKLVELALQGLGNAIVPWVAAEFISDFMHIRGIEPCA